MRYVEDSYGIYMSYVLTHEDGKREGGGEIEAPSVPLLDKSYSNVLKGFYIQKVLYTYLKISMLPYACSPTLPLSTSSPGMLLLRCLIIIIITTITFIFLVRSPVDLHTFLIRQERRNTARK